VPAQERREIADASAGHDLCDEMLLMEPVIAGIDVGATSISGGLVTPDGDILGVVQCATRGRGNALQTLLAVVDDLVFRVRETGRDLTGIGIGLPGLVDVDQGMMVSAHNLVSEIAHVPLGDRLQASTGVPVFVDNDVNALTLAEWTFGVGRGARSLALLVLGTGVGGGLLLDSQLVRGASGCAGEFGHIPIDFNGPPCVCGGRGCLCLWVGGQALADTARERLAKGTVSTLRAIASDRQQITAALIFEAAAAGDGLALELVERACQALGAGIGAIINAVDPELLVITGGVASSLSRHDTEIMARVGHYALPQALARTRIRFVPTDKRRTVLGGAALVLHELGRRGDRTATGGR
jgi:glucokinase